MRVCTGYWPDKGTPCLRMLNHKGWCPKEEDYDHGYYRHGDAELYVEVTTLSDPEPVFMETRCCLHREKIPVESVVDPDEILAYICERCDAQLEAS